MSNSNHISAIILTMVGSGSTNIRTFPDTNGK